MTDLTAAVVGTGDDPSHIAYTHGHGYVSAAGVELVACADLIRDRAVTFAETWGIASDHIYEDYGEMLRTAEPDIVSIVTAPASHAELVIGTARTGIPQAIHCEKPMADTWGNAQRMAHECCRRGINLTFNHQRRFATPVRRAKERLDAGDIGQLERIEVACDTLYDNGTHYIDLANYCNDDRPAEWVLGQVAYSEENVRFGMPNDTQGLALWEWDNGVFGLASTGDGSAAVSAVEPGLRLRGTDGTIELFAPGGPPGPNEQLRIRRAGDTDWEPLGSDGEGLHRSGEYMDDHGNSSIDRGIQDVVDAVRSGGTSELCADNALKATEIYFGAYESSRRRGRIDLPLTVEDNPLQEMIDTGDLAPGSPTD